MNTEPRKRYERKRYRQLREQGLCVRCKEPTTDGRAYCDKHRATEVERHRRNK